MPLQVSNKEQLTFCDIAACFSEEEWQLLHKWQKQLYDNVMKEINHVISSLGPLIATSVFSLRPKEKNDLSSVDLCDRGRRGDVNTSSRDVSSPSGVFKGIQQAEDIQIADEKKSFSCRSTGDATSESDLLLKVNEYLKDAWDTDEKMCSASQNTGHRDMAPVITFTIKSEDEPHSLGQWDSQRTKNAATDATSDSIKPAASIDFYEEDAYSIGTQDHRGEENFYQPADYGSMNTKRNENKDLKCHNKARLYKSIPKEFKANVVQNLTDVKHARGQMGYSSAPETRGEPSEQWESDCSQQIHPTIHQVIPAVQTFETFGTCERMIPKDDHSIPVPVFKQYACPKKVQIFQNSQTAHRQEHRGNGRYTCIECGKSFSTTSKLITHERTHTGERPYQCTMCGKSFSQKGVLLRHQIMHTGKRAHECHVCGKCFSRKDQLLRHQKIHTRTIHFQTDLT